MGRLSEFLLLHRKKAGHTSAKKFHQVLSKKGLDCNYPYYMKIEAGQLLPSSDLINQMAKILGEEVGSDLVRAYCQDQFPQHPNLFSGAKAPKENIKKILDVENSVQNRNFGQKDLNLRQVASLAKSLHHYWVFVLATMSRRALTLKEINEAFPEADVPGILRDLVKEKILIMHKEDQIEASYPDIRFPKATTEDLKNQYRRFDQWDQQLVMSSLFQQVFKRTLLRRISPRYLHLAEKQLETLVEMIKSSDEVDPKYNEDVIYLELLFKKGRLPG